MKFKGSSQDLEIIVSALGREIISSTDNYECNDHYDDEDSVKACFDREAFVGKCHNFSKKYSKRTQN